MTWVKICGTTNLEDALTAVEAGADAVGFVFYEKSPRNISVEAAREIVEKLPESVEKIGVFVIGSEPDPLDVLLHAQLTGTQNYFPAEQEAGRVVGGSKASGMSAFSKPPRFLMALPVKMFAGDEEQMQETVSDLARWGKNLPDGLPLPEGMMDTFVLDSGDLRMPGGTGKTFEWKKVTTIAEAIRQGGLRLVVAGGLTPQNVGEAMKILQPWGVDVVSGVEARPGRKDPEKVRAFVKAVRDADSRG
jgi:phosphoribosylanthranilate isomerase